MKLNFNISRLGNAVCNVGVAVATAGIVTGALDKTLVGPGLAIIFAGLFLITIGCVDVNGD